MDVTMEIAIHLGAFKNIDLYQRGIYRIVFCLLRDPESANALSSPSLAAAAKDRRRSSSISFSTSNSSSTTSTVALPSLFKNTSSSIGASTSASAANNSNNSSNTKELKGKILSLSLDNNEPSFHKSKAVDDFQYFAKDSNVALISTLPNDFPPRLSIVDGDSVQGSLDIYEKSDIVTRKAHANDTYVIPCFQSRLCYIRYLDEVFVLNEGAIFHLVLNSLEEMYRQTLMIGIRLEYCEFQGDKRKYEQSNNLVFKEVAYREIKINSSHLGVHEFVPVILQGLDTGFSYLQMMVHTAILSIKYPKSTEDLSKFMFQSFVQKEIVKDSTLNVANIKEIESDFYTIKTLEQSKSTTWAERIHSMIFDAIYISYESVRQCTKEIYESDSSAQIEGASPLMKVMLMQSNNPAFGLLTPVEFTKLIEKELEEISYQCYESWYKLLNKIQNYAPFLEKTLQKRWIQLARDRLGENILRQRHTYEELFHVHDLDEIRKVHSETAAAIRKSVSLVEGTADLMPLEDTSLYIDPFRMPVIFEDRYYSDDSFEATGTGRRSLSPQRRPLTHSRNNNAATVSAPDSASSSLSSQSSDSPGIARSVKINLARKHVIVFVFGFMGNRSDMRLFRDLLKMLEPFSVCFLSTVNEELTAHADIRILGDNLANEVMTFINNKNDVGGLQYVEYVSFVVHSLGGLIVRHALGTSILEPILPKLRTFFTLSTPHLGSKGMDSFLVSTGYSVMKTLKSSKSLEQLVMGDSKTGKLRDCFMYQLSTKPQIGRFKDIILLSGHQDQYVPYWSARLELPPSLIKSTSSLSISRQDSGSKEDIMIIAEMQKNIINSIKEGHARVTKLDISFDFSKQGNNARSMVDRFIGRAAHVQMLDSPAIIFSLILTYSDHFFSSSPPINKPSIWDT